MKTQAKLAKKMWEEFEYKHLLETPPSKKPCFLAGTLISTKTGLEEIQNLSPHTSVYTYNFHSNKVELKPVIKLYANKTEKYVRIHTQSSLIHVTGTHRFWLPYKNKWVAASQLQKEDVFKTQNNQKASVIELDIIESIEKTYNLEVKDNANYYVSKDMILVHNTNKVSKFASTELIDVEFYRIIQEIGDDINSLYVGQSIQGVDKRYVQHKRDPKKAYWKNKMDGVLVIKVNGIGGPYKMTPYEAAVTEMFEMNSRGGKVKLYNKQNPISESKFNKFKELDTFNPCKFYV